MSTTTTPLHALGDRLDVTTEDLVLWSAVLGAELLAVLAYLAVSSTTITEVRYAIYPFVWIDVGLLAVSRTSLPTRGRRVRALALAGAGAYLLALLYLGGLLQFGLFAHLGPGTEFRVSWALPGWGPIVVFRNSLLQTILVPFKLAGYLAFAYLLYARLLDATAGVLSGLFGLVSCVGCTFSLLIPLVGASTFSAVAWLSWDLSTLVFLLTIALLYWSTEISTTLSKVIGRTTP
jgi:hypothetical protein